MILTPGVLGVVALCVCLLTMIVLLVELTWAQRDDGEALRCLRGVFCALIFLFSFPFIAGIDLLVDISPGMKLYYFLGDWIWVARCVLATALIRFWLELHHYARKKRTD